MIKPSNNPPINSEATKKIEHRFKLALLGYIILALACVAGLAINYVQQQTLNDHQDAILKEIGQIRVNQANIAGNQAQIRKSQVELFRLTANTAAAICLEAFAKNQQQQVALVRLFNRTHKIDVSHNPTCQKAIHTAAQLVLVP